LRSTKVVRHALHHNLLQALNRRCGMIELTISGIGDKRDRLEGGESTSSVLAVPQACHSFSPLYLIVCLKSQRTAKKNIHHHRRQKQKQNKFRNNCEEKKTGFASCSKNRFQLSKNRFQLSIINIQDSYCTTVLY
jgi:hypothetical protein